MGLFKGSEDYVPGCVGDIDVIIEHLNRLADVRNGPGEPCPSCCGDGCTWCDGTGKHEYVKRIITSE